MKLKRKLLGAVALCAMLSATQVNAQATSNLNVAAEVPEVCQIVSAATLDMDFGVLDVVNGGAGPGSSTLANATFEYQCSAGTAVTVELDLGLGAGADLTQRVMTGGSSGDTLPYRLEKTDTTDWGDSASGTAYTATASGITTTDSVQINGIVTLADSQAADVDTYSDTVVITLLP